MVDALRLARDEMRVEDARTQQLITEFSPFCQGLTPRQIGEVLDAVWVCGYAIKKEGQGDG